MKEEEKIYEQTHYVQLYSGNNKEEADYNTVINNFLVTSEETTINNDTSALNNSLESDPVE